MCSEDSFIGETRTCVLINGDTFTAPVVNIMVFHRSIQRTLC